MTVLKQYNTSTSTWDVIIGGAQGPTGPSGVSGVSGTPSTVPGPSGPSGPQGPSGTPSTVAGPSGPSGPQGVSGVSGVAGVQGPQGVQGPAGPSGPQGPGANQALDTTSNVTFGVINFGVDALRVTPGNDTTLSSSGAVKALVVRSDGIICQNGSSAASRREYKENIRPLNESLGVLNSLTPRNFKWKDSYFKTDWEEDVYSLKTQDQYGFIVEEVAEISSDLVHHQIIDGVLVPQMWKDHAIIALSIKAVQELSKKVSELEAKLEELTNP